MMAGRSMQTASINGARLEFVAQGEGEPALLIHGALAEAFLPLFDAAALSRYRLIAYSRRGYGGSERGGPLDMRGQARDALALLEHLGAPRAHIVGHSYGAAVALQLALDSPAAVQSLALLEPPVPAVVFSSPEVGALVGQVFGAYQAGNRAAALDMFFRGFLGDGYRAILEERLPSGAFDRAVPAIEALLENDFPALQSWTFGAEEAARTTASALLAVGAQTSPLFQAVHQQMQQWFTNAESVVLPRASHLLMVMNPAGMAEALAAFFARHPMAVSV